MDSADRFIVADFSNHRVQIFNKTGVCVDGFDAEGVSLIGGAVDSSD